MESLVVVDDVEYDLTPDQIKLIKDYLNGELKAVVFNLEDKFEMFLNDLAAAGGDAAGVKEKVSLFSPSAMRFVKRFLVKSDVISAPDVFFSKPPPPPNSETTVDVPAELLGLASYKTPNKEAGEQHGSGELVIPLLFQKASMHGGTNPPYDVQINEVNWHVKGHSSKESVRMGEATGFTFDATDIYHDLVKAGISPADLGTLGFYKLTERLPEFLDVLQEKFPAKYRDLKSPADLYVVMNNQAVEKSIGAAAGVCFYYTGILQFVPASQLSFMGTTQSGRIRLSMEGKEKVEGRVARLAVEKEKAAAKEKRAAEREKKKKAVQPPPDEVV